MNPDILKQPSEEIEITKILVKLNRHDKAIIRRLAYQRDVLKAELEAIKKQKDKLRDG